MGESPWHERGRDLPTHVLNSLAQCAVTGQIVGSVAPKVRRPGKPRAHGRCLRSASAHPPGPRWHSRCLRPDREREAASSRPYSATPRTHLRWFPLTDREVISSARTWIRALNLRHPATGYPPRRSRRRAGSASDTAALRRDVESAMSPMPRASVGRRWRGRPWRRPRPGTSRRRDAERQAEGAVAIIREEPVEARSHCLPAATSTASWPAPLI